MKKLYLFLICSFIIILNSFSQATHLKTISTSNETNQTIRPGLTFNGNHYFSASKSNFLTFSTMWKTDGTESGTIDFIDSDDVFDASPIFVFNNDLYYLANELNVRTIYKTDGINSIPVITPTATSLQIGFDHRTVATLNSNFIFFYGDTTTGFELYSSDGTPGNITLVKDIRPGTASSFPNYFTKIAGNKIVFTANDGTNGTELWVTDGTSAGTQLVKDIDTSGSSGITKLTSFNGKAYFAQGNEIWESDGTEAGTQIFLNLRSDDTSDQPFYEYNNELYFTAYDTTFNFVDLWKTNGTITGSSILASGLEYADVFQKTNTLLFFAAYTNANGYELWRTDGTPQGTYLTRDINPGPEDSLVADPSLGNGGDKLFFESVFITSNSVLEDEQDGELWSSDGTEVGTLLNTTIDSGSGEGNPDDFFNINDKLIFKADADVNGNGTNAGINLWITDTNLLSNTTYTTKENNIILYPNPAKDYLIIKTNNVLNIEEISLYSLDGREIAKYYKYNSKICIENIESGTYILNIKTLDGTKKSVKFIKS